MENIVKALRYLELFLSEVKRRDPLHASTLAKNIDAINKRDEAFFHVILNTTIGYYKRNVITPRELMMDYMQMIRDMRREGVYFQKHGAYSCKSEAEAYEKVYSNPEIMDYYLNALLISQVVWSHHFEMLHYFSSTISVLRKWLTGKRVLDVGSGHGLFSFIVKKEISRFSEIDIIDLSGVSLKMARDIVGIDRVKYILTDASRLIPPEKYDFIIMGEILEHLDNPVTLLNHMIDIMNDNGYIFITVPTNAPAIDHISLFRDEMDFLKILRSARLFVMGSKIINVDSQTKIIGTFCIKR